MKRTKMWGAAVALVLTISLATVALAVAGSSEDPLVSLSYLTGTYQQSLLSQAQTEITQQVAEAEQSLSSQLQAVSATPAQTPESAATGYERITVAAGETLSFDSGTELLLLSGSATVDSGSLTDSTDGIVLGATGGVAVNHLCVGLTAGSLRFSEGAEVLICR